MVYFPFVGGTPATHAIDAVTATSVLTFVGSPTHDATGMITNGTTQYADMGNSPQIDLAQFSSHIQQYVDLNTNSAVSMGSRDNVFDSCFFRQNPNPPSDFRISINQVVLEGVHPSVGDNVPMIGTRRANNDIALYVDAVVEISSTGIIFDGLPLVSSYIAGWNNNGSPINLVSGNTKSASIGSGLLATEVTDFNTEIKAFNVILGR